MNDSIGALLRETREARRQTLEEVERATRIRVKYLAAMEAGEFNAIPSAAQTRGFLRNYSQYLGLDADQVLAEYDAPSKRTPFAGLTGALAGGRTRRPPAPAKPARPPGRVAGIGRVAGLGRARWLTADVLVGGIVIVALLGFFIWGSTRLAGVLFVSAPAATPLTLGRPSNTQTPGLTLAVELSPTATVVPPIQTLTEVPVTLNFEQTAWVSVTVDGVEEFRGLVALGNTHDYLGQTSVEVLTGNGAGVRVIYGDRDQGVLGAFGEVVLRIYTLTGAQTATASPTPAVTDTLTPTPSNTPVPSPTPRLSPTASRAPTLGPSATLRPSETPPPSPTRQP